MAIGSVVLLIVGAVCGYGSTESLRSIAERVNTMETTWKAATDLPAEMSASSFARLAGAIRSEGLKSKAPRRAIRKAVPPEFDARKAWPHCTGIGIVRDQGNCGSCWAVATASVFTDRLCIATLGAFQALLSDEELLNCCPNCGYGCDGGYPDRAWRYLSSHGIVTGGLYNSSEGCQPYSRRSCEHHTDGPLPACTSLPEEHAANCLKRCTNPSYTNKYEKDHYSSKQPVFLSMDVKQIQKEIFNNGPVEATFTVYSDFATYKSGVYQHLIGENLGGHAVKLIGWGTENGVDYWLVANSWNTHWGDGGFFKIRRGVNECGFEEDISFPSA